MTSLISPRNPSSPKLSPSHERSGTPPWGRIHSCRATFHASCHYCCIFRGLQMDLIQFLWSHHFHINKERRTTLMMLESEDEQMLLSKWRGSVTFGKCFDIIIGMDELSLRDFESDIFRCYWSCFRSANLVLEKSPHWGYVESKASCGNVTCFSSVLKFCKFYITVSIYFIFDFSFLFFWIKYCYSANTVFCITLLVKCLHYRFESCAASWHS